MTRKQIEQAANDYIGFPQEIDEGVGTTMRRNAFIDGAEWRVNSVWHDMKKEVPQVYGEYKNEVAPSIPCLVRGYLSTGYGYGVRYWNVSYEVWDDEECDDYECERDAIEEWTYLDDLLPERKEETK